MTLQRSPGFHRTSSGSRIGPVTILWLWRVLLVTFSGACAASVNLESSMSIRLQQYSLDSGLSQSVVTAIAQDKLGYLWVGTQDGLNRFDGRRFDALSLKSGYPKHADRYITAIKIDPSGMILIGTHQGMLVSADGLDFRIIPVGLKPPRQSALKVNAAAVTVLKSAEPAKPHSSVKRQNTADKRELVVSERINDIAIADQRVWLATDHGVLYAARSAFAAVSAQPVIFKQVPGSGRMAVRQVFAVDDTLFIGTWDGLRVLRIGTLKWQQFDPASPLQTDTINFIRRGSGLVYVGTEHALFQVAPVTLKLSSVALPEHTGGWRLYDVSPSSSGLWLATDSGLLWAAPGQQHWILYGSDPLAANGLPTNRLRKFLTDRQSQLWIGTFGGGLVSRNPQLQQMSQLLTRRTLARFTPIQDYWNADITALSRAANEHLFLGTRGAGIVELGAHGRPIRQFATRSDNPIASDYIQDLVFDDYGVLWVATEGGGLLYRTLSGKWHALRKNVIESDWVFDLHLDRDGRLWLGTLNGAGWIDPRTHKFHSVTAQLPAQMMRLSSRISTIYQDISGNLWFGGEAGLALFIKHTGKVLWLDADDPKSKLPGNEINSIAAARLGGVWVATSHGVARIHVESGNALIEPFTDIAGLGNRSVYAILTDQAGRVWLGSGHGILRLNPSARALEVISPVYGLSNLEVNPDAALVTDTGELYFGTINGAVKIHPPAMISDSAHTSMVLTDLRTEYGSRRLLQGDASSLDVDARGGFVELSFEVIDLASPGQRAIRYRIPRLQRNWTPWTQNSRITLSAPPPGRYQVQLQARAADGTPLVSQLFNFRVVNQKTWADYLFSITAALLLLATLGFLAWRVSLARRQQGRMSIALEREKKHHLRTTEALRQSRQSGATAEENLALAVADKKAIENQLGQLQLLDEDTSLHTPEFLRLAMGSRLHGLNRTNEAAREQGQLPATLGFVCIKIDDEDQFRFQGGTYLAGQIVRQFAHVLKEIVGPTDDVVRWDRARFLVIVECQVPARLTEICERIRVVVSSQLFGPSADESYTLRVSMGAAGLPFDQRHAAGLSWNGVARLAQLGAHAVTERGGDGWLLLRPGEQVLEDESVLEQAPSLDMLQLQRYLVELGSRAQLSSG